MPATTYHLPYTRFIRQVRTEPMALLAIDLAAQTAYDLLRQAPWDMCDNQYSDFPPRDALQDGSSPAWDAYKHVGNYKKGLQRAYAGMVAYRFTLPPAAIDNQVEVESLEVPLHVDRWLVDGVRIAAYLSDSINPVSDWDTLRNGDIMAADLLPMEYTDDDPPERIVIEKEDGIVLTLPPNSTAKRYLYVIASLEDYTTTSGTTGARPFWIEGAAAIAGTLATVTLSAAVEPDPYLRLPLAVDGDGLRLRMQGDASNILHPWLRKHWALRMLLGGRLSKSTVDVETAISAPIMRPVVSLAGSTAVADAALQRLYAPKTIAAGRTAWLRSIGTYTGDAPLRLMLYIGESRPNLDNPATWEGTGSAVVGSAIVSPPSDGDLIPIRITRNISPGNLWLIATLADIPATDQPAISGYAPDAGISVLDAHIAAAPVSAGYAPEWIEFNGGDAGALLMPLLFGSGTNPAPILYGLGQYCSIANAKASGIAWLSDKPEGVQGNSSAASNWGLTVAGSIIHLAGTTYPAGATDADGETAALAFATSAGVVGLGNSNNPVVFGALMSVYFPNFSTEAYDIVVLFSGYKYLMAVVETTPGTYTNKIYGSVSNVDVGFRSAVEGAAPIVSAAASTTHLIVRNNDNTCTVYDNSALSDPSAGIDVSSWTNIKQVAAVPNAVFGLKADGTVVASGLINGWCDLDQLDGLTVDSIVACNHAQRVAFHIDRS
ncbi:MAG: hypothetical protein M0Q49_01850 [Porticoccaceae bacterium]|nr:hypothetical protein [Porticoccaceae bacterium]